MIKDSIEERRNGIRAKRILSIQFRLKKSKFKGGNTEWHLSTTHDMSFSGLSFLSDAAYHIDDILEIHVVMSGVLDIFKGKGQVVRIEKKSTGAFYLIAVKFIENGIIRRKGTSRPVKKTPRNRIKKS